MVPQLANLPQQKGGGPVTTGDDIGGIGYIKRRELLPHPGAQASHNAGSVHGFGSYPLACSGSPHHDRCCRWLEDEPLGIHPHRRPASQPYLHRRFPLFDLHFHPLPERANPNLRL